MDYPVGARHMKDARYRSALSLTFLAACCLTFVAALGWAQLPADSRGFKTAQQEPATSAGRRLMVVIGIDDYREWPTLRNAVGDAAGFAKVMREKLGFSLIGQLLNEQASKHDILQLVENDLRKQLKQDDDLVVFFAGHGTTRVDKVGGKEVETGFIVPFDARVEQEEQWSDYIQVDQFLEAIGKLPARHVLVLLDSCFSGFALGPAVDSYRGGEVRYQRDLGENISRKVISSARRNQLASDKGPLPGHSLFTGALIDGIDSGSADLDGDGVITSSELGLYLQQQVGRATASSQTPDYGSFYLDQRGEMLLSVLQKPAATQVVEQDVKTHNSRSAAAFIGFKNILGKPDQDWISTALSEMLRTELGAGDAIRTIPEETVARVRKELPALDGANLSRETLTTAYQSLASDFIISGSYLEMGGHIRVDIQVQNALLGDNLGTFSDTDTEGNFFELVQRIGRTLRGRCGTGEATPEQAAAARTALPRSPQALQLYSEALDRLRVYDYRNARDLLQKAIANDPQNATMRATLANTLEELGFDDQAREEGQRAFELSAGLERKESLMIEAEYRQASQQWDKAIELYKSLWTFFPDDPEYALKLASAQVSGGKAQDALATLLALRKLPRPKRDDPRIDLAEAAAARSLSDYKRQKLLSSSALQKANRQGANLLGAQAMLQQCQAQRRLGELEGAKKSGQQAQGIFHAAQDLKSEAKSLTCIANSVADHASSAADYASSLALHNQALALARQTGAQADIAGALINIGNLLASEQKIADSTRNYEEALAVAVEIGDKRDSFGAENDIASNLMLLGDFMGAKKMLESAVDAARAIGDQNGIVEAQLNVAAISYLEGNLQEAQQFVENSLALARDANSKDHVASALRALGDVLLVRGAIAEAEKKYRDSLAIRTQLGDKAGVADSQAALALAALESNKRSDAEALARSAANEFQLLGDADQEVLALDVLIQCLIAQSRFSEAGEQLQRAQKLNSRDLSADTSLAITAARLLARQNDRSAAITKLDQLTEEMKKKNLLYYELLARLARAEAAGGASLEDRSNVDMLFRDADRTGFRLIAQKADRLR
jgi:TolB-like protein/predicted Zn-dependent protease